MSEGTPVYVISVAARLLQVHPQTLRNYERAGFLRPTRTEGERRLYSAEDIERLRHLIGTVEHYGLNLRGLKLLLTLRDELLALDERLDAELDRERAARYQAQVRRMLALLAEGRDTAPLAGSAAEEPGARAS
jgi:MerR family transcriptional regulator/heat shock protein HspR